MSGTCEEKNITETPQTPYFKLIARQQTKAGWHNPWVTFMHGWRMEWKPIGANEKIYLKWDLLENNSRLMLDTVGNGTWVEAKFPHFYDDYQILTEGTGIGNAGVIYFGIITFQEAADPGLNFRIKLVYHMHSMRLHLDCDYQEQICGMMGDWDGDRDNDWWTPEGNQIAKPPGYPSPRNQPAWVATFEFGNSWLKDSDYCEADGHAMDQEFDCMDADIALIESATWCGKILTSPFSDCGIDNDVNYHSCKYDLCMVDKDEWMETLCMFLEDTESKCQEAQTPLTSWRTNTVYPPP